MATGISSKRIPPGRADRQRGFTLIEVLVVVIIIGIMSAMVVISTNLIDDDRALRQEARRLATLIELAADEAVLQGRDFGIEFIQRGYRFLELDPVSERWFEVADDELLRARQLGEDLELELFIEDRRVLVSPEFAQLDNDANEDDTRAGAAEAGFAPHALILSSGDIYPFELLILRALDESEYPVRVTPAGAVETGPESSDAD